MRITARLLASLVTLALVAAACGGDDGEPVTEGTVSVDPLEDPTPTDGTTPTTDASTSEPGSARVEVALEEVARLDSLTAMTQHPQNGDLYIAERVGRVQIVDPESGDVRGPIIDIRDEVSTDGERGLLGVAIAPEGDLLYLSYTDVEGDTRVHELALRGDGSVDPATRREVFTIEQPFANHNGGQVSFGPDDLLYLGLGDGGGGGDPLGTGQDPTDLLGTIIRIDPRGGDPYAIPADNPFVEGSGGAPEVWLWGVRNPWRFSWDQETADLWVGDVGQNAIEEIDHLPAPDAGRGANLGWPRMEGDQPFEGGTPPDDHTPPIHQYPNPGQGCSVTGGYVYRGSQLAFLDGVYVYGDFCAGDLLGLRVEDGELIEELDLGLNVGEANLVSFGQDRDGELYVLGLDGVLYRLVAG